MKQKFIIDVNPSTGEIIEKIKCSSPSEVSSAVKNSRKAYKFWRDVPLKTRLSYFKKIIRAIRNEKNFIAESITCETGKPIKYSQKEVTDAVKQMENILSFSEEALCEEIFKSDGDVSKVVHTPFGVIAIICSWNNPFYVACEYLTTTIIAGNTAILKPSEIAPGTGTIVYNLFNNFLPKGVINILQGADEVCECLLNTDINYISYIGSKAKGKSVISSSVSHVHGYTLQLISKHAMILTEDASLDKASDFAIKSIFYKSGHNANSIGRIYVNDKIYDDFISQILQKIRKVRFGNPFEDVDVGAIATENLLKKVCSQIEDVRHRGAKILFGGSRIENGGFYLMPTVIADISDKNDLMCEETFGPVLAIQRYDDIENVIEKINKSQIGIEATVWSRKIKNAEEIAKKLEVGMVGINKSVKGAKGSPSVCIKQSGCGYMGCVDSLKLFTYPKKYTY